MLRLYLAMQAALADAGTPSAQRASRGAAATEYVLALVLAGAIFLILQNAFPNLISGLWENIQDAINVTPQQAGDG